MTQINPLRQARDLIADRKYWCSGTLAADKSGFRISPFSIDAEQWCAEGALMYCANKKPAWDTSWFDYLRTAAEELFGKPPFLVNDRMGHTAVLQMFDRAIQLSEKRDDSV